LEGNGGDRAVACVPEKIRSEHLPNKGLERYRYANPLDRIILNFILEV
jgi:hypothetical protein